MTSAVILTLGQQPGSNYFDLNITYLPLRVLKMILYWRIFQSGTSVFESWNLPLSHYRQQVWTKEGPVYKSSNEKVNWPIKITYFLTIIVETMHLCADLLFISAPFDFRHLDWISRLLCPVHQQIYSNELYFHWHRVKALVLNSVWHL